MNSALAATIVMNLEPMSDDIVNDAYKAIVNLGQIPRGSLAYDPLRAAGLISERGLPVDGELMQALIFEMDRRMGL